MRSCVNRQTDGQTDRQTDKRTDKPLPVADSTLRAKCANKNGLQPFKNCLQPFQAFCLLRYVKTSISNQHWSSKLLEVDVFQWRRWIWTYCKLQRSIGVKQNSAQPSFFYEKSTQQKAKRANSKKTFTDRICYWGITKSSCWNCSRSFAVLLNSWTYCHFRSMYSLTDLQRLHCVAVKHRHFSQLTTWNLTCQLTLTIGSAIDAWKHGRRWIERDEYNYKY